MTPAQVSANDSVEDTKRRSTDAQVLVNLAYTLLGTYVRIMHKRREGELIGCEWWYSMKCINFFTTSINKHSPIN